MPKIKTQYSCTECGGIASKWGGQCPACGQWNTLVESVIETGINRYSQTPQSLAQTAPVLNLSQIEAMEVPRFSTGIDEFDRVLGGGLVAGGVVLIGGDPGIGKSTLLLQALAAMVRNKSVVYVSGEESGAQIALRSKRLGIENSELKLQAEIQLEKILITLSEHKPQVVVIDSIQTLYSDALSSAPGSVAQVRETAAQLTRAAKLSNITIIMVGHVTKDGALAGPRVLEHIVDTVLYFEGDTHSSFRLVRAIKNRFGAVNELGVFAMTERGLKGVTNPSALFLSQHDIPVAGSCVMVNQEPIDPFSPTEVTVYATYGHHTFQDVKFAFSEFKHVNNIVTTLREKYSAIGNSEIEIWIGGQKVDFNQIDTVFRFGQILGNNKIEIRVFDSPQRS